jgi:hypothetical protein
MVSRWTGLLSGAGTSTLASIGIPASWRYCLCRHHSSSSRIIHGNGSDGTIAGQVLLSVPRPGAAAEKQPRPHAINKVKSEYVTSDAYVTLAALSTEHCGGSAVLLSSVLSTDCSL